MPTLNVSFIPRLLFWFLCLAVALVSWRFLVFGVEASMPAMAYHLEPREWVLYAHIFVAPVALAIVPFQALHRLRQNRPALHRLLGRIYAVAVLVSGTAGLVLAVTTNAGPVAALGFATLAVLWLGATAVGVWHARAGRQAQHRVWMMRSIALTFAGVMLRLWLPILHVSGVSFDIAYVTVSWLCWVPNVIVIELWLRRRKSRRNMPIVPG